MSELIRLVYASEAAFEAAPVKQGVEPSVARILMQSRRNNSRENIGGVLYFGDGHFFQALEGDRNAVNRTYQRIAADPRHRNVTILSLKTVPNRLFADWSMKYVPVEQAVREFVRSRDYQRFEPLRFREEEAEALIKLFHQQQNGDAAAVAKKRSWFGLRNLFFSSRTGSAGN
ncbi:BLUF domain-containing protein [Microbulbifer marinus]|uniref:Sensors of blue-light using FAD n=1 Tax=Microbulbifer marinus TaxID=658218 RepID=A0A1H3WVB2_9GAMM|nr:BLUF domain-containing protein [Microbulbifer marinus]SDZ91096.1 Sensors of blue-light using FAD [Microbulbifer marinus]